MRDVLQDRVDYYSGYAPDYQERVKEQLKVEVKPKFMTPAGLRRHLEEADRRKARELREKHGDS